MQRSLVEDDEKKMRRSKTVPREQYDNLLIKYEELSKKYEQLKENPQPEKQSLVDELQKSSTENFAQTSSNVETVDAFSDPATKPQVERPSSNEAPSRLGDLESQLQNYRKGVALRTSNPGEATKIFQQLDGSSHAGVQARAKYQLGEMLMEKGQFDLALQVFEDIINNKASSGVVIDALKQAKSCSEKLGIQNKKDQYSSMLTDVFGTR
jgi:TolA-binding protein